MGAGAYGCLAVRTLTAVASVSWNIRVQHTRGAQLGNSSRRLQRHACGRVSSTCYHLPSVRDNAVVHRAALGHEPSVTLTYKDADTFWKLLDGRLSPQAAVMTSSMKVKGSVQMVKALQVRACFCIYMSFASVVCYLHALSVWEDLRRNVESFCAGCAVSEK
jgi:putative sterol carrier protein